MSKLIVANWKMEMAHMEAIEWLHEDYPEVRITADNSPHELVICPSFTELSYATEHFFEDQWGAQNCGTYPLGPFTGEVSAISLAEMGVFHVIVGHSERRELGETNEMIKGKIESLLPQFINPIVCIGETLEQRESYKEVLFKQLEVLIEPYTKADISPIIAYEPIWAIGSGKTPKENQLEEVVNYIKEVTAELKPSVLYGGSVMPGIAKRFSPLVDGYLVGSASLNPELLKKIILSC